MEHIKVTSNPLRGEESLLSFSVSDVLGKKESQLSLSYVADREIVTDEDFMFWFSPLLEQEWTNAETFCAAILAAFYNDVLPFYIQIKLVYKAEGLSMHRQIQLIKKQPKYQLPEDLKRIQ